MAPIDQAAYFRNAQAPATGLAALSAPARLVLLTEQTRDFEAGRHAAMYSMLRRYILGAAAVMVVAVPVLWLLMPWLMQIAFGADYREHATTAARLVLIAAALQFIWGWTKSFPVSIGRPGLRERRARGRDGDLRAAAARARRASGARPARRGGDGRLDGGVLPALGGAARRGCTASTRRPGCSQS